MCPISLTKRNEKRVIDYYLFRIVRDIMTTLHEKKKSSHRLSKSNSWIKNEQRKKKMRPNEQRTNKQTKNTRSYRLPPNIHYNSYCSWSLRIRLAVAVAFLSLLGFPKRQSSSSPINCRMLSAFCISIHFVYFFGAFLSQCTKNTHARKHAHTKHKHSWIPPKLCVAIWLIAIHIWTDTIACEIGPVQLQ